MCNIILGLLALAGAVMAIHCFKTKRAYWIGWVSQVEDPFAYWVTMSVYIAIAVFGGSRALFPAGQWPTTLIMAALICLWLILPAYAIYAIKRGKFNAPVSLRPERCTITRADRPVLFWFNVIFMILLGIGMFIATVIAVLKIS